MNLTLVTEITDSMINKAFEKINKIHWGGWTNEDFLLGLGNVDELRLPTIVRLASIHFSVFN